MTSLTRSYKKLEASAFRQVSARLRLFAKRLGAAAGRAMRGSSRGITVLVVDDSARPPRGLRISYLGLGLILVAAFGLVALTLAFAAGSGAEDPKLAGQGAKLEAARAELDALRDEASRLAGIYASLGDALGEINSLVDKPKALATFDPVSGAPDSAARNSRRLRGEVRRLDEARAGLEAAIAPLDELGGASAAMAGIKPTVPALWPIKSSLGHLSATFGPNPNPFTGEPYFHKGIDCSNYREGDPIVATADGVVVFAGVQGGYGRSVVISHPNGYFTRYGHMQRIVAKSGQAVKQGQVIGIVGNTGNSTGPHTHYEVIVGNNLVDPIDYLWSQEDRKAPEGTVPFGFD